MAGPLLIDGEHARGEFYVPLATTEGTLVASYNRGMKLLHRAGGVRATVMDDVMQRAPAFGFDSAREARAFGAWVTTHFGAIKDAAEATTHTGHLRDVEQFTASRFLFLRFSYTTGDAAGQNMAGKATASACTWIRARYPGIRQFCLESNLAGQDKSYADQQKKGHRPPPPGHRPPPPGHRPPPPRHRPAPPVHPSCLKSRELGKDAHIQGVPAAARWNMRARLAREWLRSRR